MQYSNSPSALSALLLTLTVTAAILAQAAARSLDGRYTDIDTSITFQGHGTPTGYLFGMVMPQKPTTDLIVQLVSPLGTDGGGWGGISFGTSMTGPLLLVTWPSGNKVMTAARVAKDYTTTGVVPYTANPIALSPIKQGTFVNSTHVSATFLCGGCINNDSFGPAWAESDNQNILFGYASTKTAVEDPSNANTGLSDHMGTGGDYGTFRIALRDAISSEYGKYSAMAEVKVGKDGAMPERPQSSSTGSVTSSSTRSHRVAPTPTAKATASSTTLAPAATTDVGQGWRAGCWETECETPEGPDFSHREMPRAEFFALVVLGAAYLVQAFLE